MMLLKLIKDKIEVNTLGGANRCARLFLDDNEFKNTLAITTLAETFISNRQGILPKLRDKIMCACYLHGIGHVDELIISKHPSVDAYLYTHSNGWDSLITEAIKRHSFTKELLYTRGRLDLVRAHFDYDIDEETKIITDILTLCIMHIDSKGQVVKFEDKVEETKRIFGYESVQYKHIEFIKPKVLDLAEKYSFYEFMSI